MSLRLFLAVAVIAWVVSSLGAPVPSQADQAEALWFEKVQPLLDRSCFKCHGGVRQKSGLDLRSLQNILKGGDRGPAILPGEPDESHLYQFVLKGADPHMPQDEAKQLKDNEIASLRSWIGVLPSTNSVHVVAVKGTNWVPGYLQAYRALLTPTWVPPQGMPAPDVIDHFIELGWKQTHLEASLTSDDATFARRLYLDLTGRIPTVAELESFESDQGAEKRSDLIERLLRGEDYPRHMREVFDVVLLERRGSRAEEERRLNQWFTFLEHAFAENYGWDRIVREIILGRPTDPQDRGVGWYLYEKHDKYQAMAEAVAPIAFGVQINCAQCHNHPLAAEVEQRHYWGLVAAFNRSKNVDTTNGPGVAESTIGGFISFANLRKESQPAQLAFLNGVTIPEQRPADGEKETNSPDLYLVPPPGEKDKPAQASVPKFSRRAALAEAATHDNPQLARAFVNRVWALFMGRGFVQPVDQLDSRHRPSHPDLLNWLAGEFEGHHYDIRWLIRQIALSRTYQLDSRPLGSKDPPPAFFARGPEKLLSGEQLCRSFLVATGNLADRDGKLSGYTESEIRQAFVAQFPDLFAREDHASLQQATYLSNSPILDRLMQAREGNTTARMIQEEMPSARVALAFRTVFGRQPDADELARCLAFLAHREVATGAKELLWALLASSEFQMNH